MSSKYKKRSVGALFGIAKIVLAKIVIAKIVIAKSFYRKIVYRNITSVKYHFDIRNLQYRGELRFVQEPLIPS